MKILALLPTYRPAGYPGNIGGGEISNRILLEGLASAGHLVTVLTFSGGGEKNTVANGVRVVEPRGMNSGGAIDWLVKRILYRYYGRGLINWDAPDVIIATTDTVAIGSALGSRYRLPTAIFIRAFENLEITSRNKTASLLSPKAFVKRAILGDRGLSGLKKADLLVTNSEYMENVCQKRVEGVATEVIYPPLDIHVTERSPPGSIKVASMVGTDRKKGTTLLSSIAARLPGLIFRIVGCPDLAPGDSVKVRNLVRLGWCDTEVEFRERADIVLVPSQWDEPFGRVAVEALAVGKIPFVADIGGLPEAVARERDLIIPANDESAWVSRLVDVINSPDKYRAAAVSARASIGKFGVKSQVKNLEVALGGLPGSHETLQ